MPSEINTGGFCFGKIMFLLYENETDTNYTPIKHLWVIHIQTITNKG